MFQIRYVNLLHKIICNASIFLRSTEGGVGGWGRQVAKVITELKRIILIIIGLLTLCVVLFSQFHCVSK